MPFSATCELLNISSPSSIVVHHQGAVRAVEPAGAIQGAGDVVAQRFVAPTGSTGGKQAGVGRTPDRTALSQPSPGGMHAADDGHAKLGEQPCEVRVVGSIAVAQHYLCNAPVRCPAPEGG